MQRRVASVAGSDEAAAAAAWSAKALTVPQFYHIFHYAAQNAPILQQATGKLRKLRQQQQQQAAEASDGEGAAEADGGGGDDNRVCSICLSADVEVALSCLHAFCSACIEDWHSHDRSCPLCRVKADVNGAGGDEWADVWRLDGGSEAELTEVCETISSFPHQFLRDKPDFID